MRSSSTSLAELCTYLSRLELERIAAEGASALSSAERPSEVSFEGAVLFVDVTGFTPITETLAKQGPRGAETLSEILNDYYGRLTGLVADRDGDVLFFAGDAAVALFRPASGDAGEAVALALSAGSTIRRALDGFAPAAAPEFRLSLRAMVGAGRLRALRVGSDPRLLLVSGSPFEQIARGNGIKRTGGVTLSREADRLLREHGEEIRREPGGSGSSLRAVSPDPSSIERALPEVVVQRLQAGQREFLAEFRTVSVVFVSLSSSFIEPPCEELHAVVTSLEEVVARYEGAVYQFVEDDKGTTLIVSFGIPPRVHEDDAVRATLFASEAAAELRERASAWETAIGVATGRLFCGAYGGATRRQYALVGPTINRAARLMQAASAEGILCDEATRRAAGRRADFEERGTIYLKGIEEPVKVFRPAYDPAMRSGRRRTTPRLSTLVGRTVEQEALGRVVEALREGTGGTAVLVEAEAGMGKSRLVSELCRLASLRGVRAIRGDADAMAAGAPYYAFRSVLAELLGVQDLDARAAQARVLEQLADARDLLPMAPLLTLVLPIVLPETALTEQMTAQIRAENLARLLLHFLARAAEAEPLLLVLEDAHWLDSASWALAALFRRSVKRATVVVTLRPMERPPVEYGKLAENAIRLALPPMNREQTVHIVEQRLGVHGVPSSLVDFVVARAEGNPFYIEEIVLSLRDAGRVRVVGDRIEVEGDASLSELSFPASLEAVITSRIDRLAASEQLVLKVASVVGRHFDEAAVEDALPVPEDRAGVPAVLERLKRLDLVQRERDSTWLFCHALTRETTYGVLSYSQRRSLHRAVAEHLERRYAGDPSPIYARLAHHWDLAEDRAKAMTAYGLAGEQSVAAYANEEAVLHLTKALELDAKTGAPPTSLRRARWLKMLGDAHYSLAGHERARAAYEAALRTAGFTPPRGALGATIELGRHLARRLRKRITGVAADPVGAEERERVLHAMQTVAELGAVLLWKGDRTRFLESAFMHRNMADLAGPCGASAAAMSGGGYVLAMMGLRGLAERDLEQAVALAEQDPALLPRIQACVMHGMFLSATGRPEAAVAPLKRAGVLADELGGGLWKHRAKFMLGEPLILLGAYEEAARAFGEAAVHSAGAEPTVVGFSYAMQALSVLRLGDVEGALALLEGPRGIAMIRPTTVPLQLFASLGPLAEARLAKGDLAGALDAVREAEAAAPGEEANGYFAAVHGHAAACNVYLSLAEEASRGFSPLGRGPALAEARRAIRRFHKFARTFPGAVPGSLLAEGRLSVLSGRLRAAERTLERAARAAAASKMPYEEARAHYVLAALESGARRNEHLQRAASLFDRFGMKRELSVVRDVAK